MEPISIILTTGLGYILKGALDSKAADTAKEELSEGFWNWIKPLFLEDVPELETNPESPATELKVSDKLVDLLKDEAFFEELTKRINFLKKAGVKEKNIVGKDIIRVKKVKIGDGYYNINETYDRKNIVEGNVSDIDEFTLGDGH